MVVWQDRHKLVTAVYGLVFRGNKILLMRRFNTGYMDGKYGVPSGHVENEESLKGSMVREFYEEIGIKVKTEDLEFIHLQSSQSETKDHQRVHVYFRINDPKEEPINAEPDKCDELVWCDIDSLPQNLSIEIIPVLKAVQQGQNYSEYNFE